jgi:hypothetical protein
MENVMTRVNHKTEDLQKKLTERTEKTQSSESLPKDDSLP